MSPMLSIPVFQVHLNHRSRINWRTFLAQFGLVCSEFVICSNMNSKRTLKMFFWFHILILNCCCAPNPGWTETVTKRGEETSETRSSVVGSHGSLRICDKVGRRPFGLGSCSRYMPGKGSGCYFNQMFVNLHVLTRVDHPVLFCTSVVFLQTPLPWRQAAKRWCKCFTWSWESKCSSLERKSSCWEIYLQPLDKLDLFPLQVLDRGNPEYVGVKWSYERVALWI